ncbi:MAG: lytic transglycosylase domain-containing protein [Actinomycetota bacterium]|nr:lytic transglycosylase domain-containing protein [Actinomycetota bacterium]
MRLQARFVGAALACTTSLGCLAAVHGVSPAPAAPARALSAVDVTVSRDVAPSASRSAPIPGPVRVAPLRTLRSPDLVVTLRHSLTPAQGQALHAIRGVAGLTVLDMGTVRIDGQPALVAGVNPSQFRQFTPRESAVSDPLWAAVARGELASTYSLARLRHLPLGGQAPLVAGRATSERVGALAVFGLPGIDAVVSRTTAADLGVPSSTAVVLDAPGRDIDALTADVRGVLGSDAQVAVVRQAVFVAGRYRPRNYRELYIDSARYCPGLPWQVLAAIGQVESGHGRNVGPSSAGALGPMQFLPSTWAYYGVDGDGDGRADIMNPYDAVPAAALYLCRNGGGQGGQALYDAIFAYNHADWYVRLVLSLAAQYR